MPNVLEYSNTISIKTDSDNNDSVQEAVEVFKERIKAMKEVYGY